jgi:WD40 repeat protein
MEAYRYRGFIHSTLGHENRADSDIRKAKALAQKETGCPSKVSVTQETNSENKQQSPLEDASSSSWQLVQTLEGHQGEVTALALHNNGKFIASASSDHTIKLWNLASYKLLFTLLGHTASVLAVAISPDGQILASGSQDCTIKIWNLSTGRLLRTLTGHTGAVSSLAFNGDRSTLISGSHDKSIKIWQFNTGKLLHTLTQHQAPVVAIAVSPNQKKFASSDRHLTNLWDNKLELLQSWTENMRLIQVPATIDSNKLLVLERDSKMVKFTDLISNCTEGELAEDYDTIMATSVDHLMGVLAFSSKDSNIKLWRLGQRNSVHKIQITSTKATVLLFTPNSQIIIGGCEDATVKIWKSKDVSSLN